MNNRGDVNFQDILILFVIYILTLSIVSSVANVTLLDNSEIELPSEENPVQLDEENNSLISDSFEGDLIIPEGEDVLENSSLDPIENISEIVEDLNDTLFLENISEQLNETIISENITNSSLVDEISFEEILEEEINESFWEIEEIIQGEAMVGKGVQWTKRVYTNNLYYQIEIPEGSVQIKRINEDIYSPIEYIPEEGEEGFYFEVMYETPSPIQIEERFGEGKKIIISSDFHYENVSTSVNLTESLILSEKDRLVVYWEEEGDFLEFEVIDTDNDGFIDEVEWIVPHLSTQTFLIYIFISEAEHLDENRTLISDIYFEVSALDNIWSEEIYEGEYVRIKFEDFLDNSRDITIYPRILSGEPVVEVYEKNGDIKIAEFVDLKNEDYNKIYLTSLIGLQDTFDLKVLNGSLQFDYIVDPVDFTPQTCSAFWGFDCSTGPPETGGTNTFDGCSSGAGNDESVEEIYLNVTAVMPGDAIEVTCTFDPYTSNDDAFIWYYNGTGWRKLFERINFGSASLVNETVTFTADNVIGDHWVRCGIIYVTGSDTDECMDTGTYYDNDDIGFEVVLNEPPTIPTSLECNGGSCDIVVDSGVDLNCSGSTDVDGDTITYFVKVPFSNILGSGDLESLTKQVTAGNYFFTSNYNYATCTSGTTCSAYESDVDVFPFAGSTANRNDYTLPSAAEYIAISSPDGSSWTTDNPGAGDEIVAWFHFNTNLTESPFLNMQNIDFNYLGNSGGASTFSSWLLTSGAAYQTDSSWTQLGGTTAIPANTHTWVNRSISSGFSNYINSTTGLITWLVASSVSAQVMNIDYAEMKINYSVAYDNEWISSWEDYSSIVGDSFQSINNISIQTRVVNYNPVGSANSGNNRPDLEIALYNGTDYVSGFYYGIEDVLGGDFSNGIDTNFTLTITDSTILSAWENPLNRLIQIRGVNLDVETGDADLIEWDGVWFLIDGEQWSDIGNHTPSTVLSWDTSLVSDFEGITFGCSAVDLTGNGNQSEVYSRITSFAVDHTNPLIDFSATTNLTGTTIFIGSIYAGVNIVETNFQNVTFSLYNSTNVLNQTTFTDSSREITWVGLESGIYFYNVTTFDNVSRSNFTETRNITIDLTYPLIDFGEGVEQSGVSVSQDWIYVNVTIIEDNFANVTFYLYDAIGYVDEFTFTGSTRNLLWTDLDDGFYEYNVTTYDLGGLGNSTLTRNITLDTTAPSGILTSPPGGTHTNNPSQTFEADVSDSNGLKQAILYIFNQTGSLIHTDSMLISGLAASVGLIYAFLAEGIYNWYYRVIDVADNFYEIANRTIVFDNSSSVISLESILNNSGDIDGNLIFEYNVTDTWSNISNCSLILNGEIYNTSFNVEKNVIESFNAEGLSIGSYNWSVQCFDNATNLGVSELKYFEVIFATAFNGQTTDFSTVDVSHISNLILEKTMYGRIQFNEEINLSGGVNLNSLVTMSLGYVNVNSIAEPRLNKSATIVLYNLDYEFVPIIWKDGNICQDCVLNYYTGGNLSFDVTSFSNYSLSENSEISIWDSTDSQGGNEVKFANDQINFYANYTNITSGESINGTGVYCNITFIDGEQAMVFNGTSLLYEYNRSFSIYGDYDYDVFCNGSSGGFEVLNAEDVVEVSTPEISMQSEYGYKVQSAQTTISATSQIININPVNNVSHTMILPPFYYSTGQRVGGTTTTHNNADYTIRLVNESAIQVDRTNSAYSITASWQLIEATKEEFNVTRGEYDATSSGNDFYIPIGKTVGISNSMAWVTGYRSTSVATTEYDNFLMTAHVYNSTHLRVQRQASGTNVIISWEVVEWNLDKIDSFQTGTDTVVGSTHTNSNHLQVSLPTTVNTDCSMMFFQIDTSGNGLDQVAVAGYLSGASTIDFYASSVGTAADYAGNRNVRWNVVDFGEGCGFKDRGQIDYSSDDTWTTHDETLTSQITLDKSIVFASLTHDGTGTAFPRPFPNVQFTDNDTLNIYRTYNGQEAYIEWQVLELPYGDNQDAPQFSNFAVNKSYAAKNEVVRINLSVTDVTNNINYVNGLISGTAKTFVQNGDEWYYDWICTDSELVNFTWVIARDDGDPARWNLTDVYDTYFICDVDNPFIEFNNTLGDGTYSPNNYLYVEVNLIEDNFKNITYGLYNSSGLVNSTTYTSFIDNINFTGLFTDDYYYNVTVYDLSGQSNFTETRVVHVDVDNPLIEYNFLTEENNSVIEGEDIYVKVNVTEDNEANITFTLYNSGMSVERQNFFDTPQRDITWNNLVDGTYYYEVKIYDLVNRYNVTELRKIVLDNTVPIIDYGVGVEFNTTNVSRNWIYVNVSVSVQNEKNITFSLRNSTGIVNETNSTSPLRIINWTNLPSEDYYYDVIVFDQLDRSDITETRMIRLDMDYPLIGFGDGTEMNEFNVSQDWIYVNVSLIESYLKNVTFSLYNSTSLVNTTTYNNFVDNINFTSLSDGKYTYNVSACDFSGNCNLTSSRNMTLDTTIPDAVLFSPLNLTYSNNLMQNLIANFTDNIELKISSLKVYNSAHSLINETNKSIAGIINSTNILYNFSTDGNYTWTYEVFDFVNHNFVAEENLIIIDRMNPSISYTVGTENTGTNFKRDWVYINTSAYDLNFANITFDIWGAETRSITFTNSTREMNFTDLLNGQYFYTAKIMDKAGNENTTGQRLIGLDTTGPTVKIYQPIVKVYSYNVSLPLNYTVEDNYIGLDKCWWNIDDGINNTVVCGTNVTFNTIEGEHQIKVYANDTFGNLGEDNVYFSVSVTGPGVTLLNPENNTFYSVGGFITFNYTAYDPDLVDSCSIYGDWNGGWHLNQTDYNWAMRKDKTFFDDFEGGSLGSNWTTYRSNAYSGIGVRTESAYSGIYSVIADSTVNNQYQLSELITTKDFSTAENMILNFWYYDWTDEDNAGADHAGHQNGDAVYYTCDGNYWYHLYNLFGTASWQNVNINVSADATFCAEVNSSFAIKFTQYDNFGLTSDGIGWDDITINYSAIENKPEGNFSVYLTDEGNYNWNVMCNDTLGYDKFSINNWSFILDTTSPQVDYGLNTEANEANKSQNWIYVNVSVFESNEKNITFSLYNSTGLVNKSVYYTPIRTINWTNLAQGKYFYNVTVIDGASRENTTLTRNITLDWSNPDALLNTPSNNYYTNNTYQNLTVNATDNLGLKEAILYIFNQTGSLIHTDSIFISGLAASIGLVYTFLADGIYNWYYRVIDIADNFYDTGNNTIIIDTVYPSLNYSTGMEIDTANVSHNWIYVNASVYDLNFANITFDLVGPESYSTTYSDSTREINWTGLDDGTYYYNVTVKDKANQVNSTSTRRITLETVPPQVTVISPLAQSYSTNIIDFNVTLNEIGSCNFTFDSGSTFYVMDTQDNLSFNYTNSSMGQGDFTVEFYCWDWVGNLNNTESVDFDVDTLAPQVSFVYPTENNNTFFNRNFITANVSVIEPNEKNITFQLVGPDSFTNTYTDKRRTINWTFLKEGIFYYNISVYDNGGNFNKTETRKITLDRTKPIVDFGANTLQENANVSRTWVFVEANVTELYPNSITYILYNFANVSINQTTKEMTNVNLNNTINWTGLSDGTYYYMITSYDKAGNAQNSSQRRINLDTLPPVVNFGFGTEEDGAEFERNWIYASSIVNDLHFKNISYSLYNDSGFVNQTGFDTLVTSLNWSDLLNVNTTYYYNISAWDYAGNIGFTETRNITLIDVTPPQVILIHPLNTTYTYNESILLNYTLIEPNLEVCWYNIDGGINVTVPGCGVDYFDVADEQVHTLYFFVNDTMGYLTSENVTFFVNSSLIFTNDYRIQRGSLSVDGTTDISVDTYDPKKSFIIHTSRSSDSGPDSLQVTSKFLNSKNIQFENYVAGAGANVEYTVVTGPDILVQRNEIIYGTATGTTGIAINQVNISNSFIIVESRLNSGNGDDNSEGFWTGKFVNDSYIEFQRGATGVEGVISYQVVSWDGVNVQSGTGTISAGSTNSGDVPINQIDLTKSFLITSERLESDTSIGDLFVRSYFFNDTTLQFERWLNGGTSTIEYFVVSSDRFISQSDSYTHLLQSTPQYDNLNYSLTNFTRAFDIHSHENDGPGTTFSNGFVTQNINSATQMVLQKGTVSNNGETTWFAVEIKDLISPDVNLSYPSDNQSFSSPIVDEFDFSVFDYQPLMNCSLWGNWSGGWHLNQTLVSPSTGALSFSSVNVSNSGDYIWNVVCTDQYGNSGWALNNFTFNIDVTAPEISYMPSTTPNASILSQNWVFVNVSVVDSHLDSVILQFNGINESFDNNDGIYYWENKTSLLGGEYNFMVYARDLGGLHNSTDKRFVSLDLTAPSWFNANQSLFGSYSKLVHQEETMNLYSSWTDFYGLNNSWLATNESGIWENKTLNYSSPKEITGTTNQSIFYWFNSSVDIGQEVYWKIYGQDIAGNVNGTIENKFTMWGYMQAESFLTEQGIREGAETTMVCNISNNFTLERLPGQTVSFYVNSTYLGDNVTDSNGVATNTFSVQDYGTYEVRCNISDNETIYYHASNEDTSYDILGVGYGYFSYDFSAGDNKAYEGDVNDTSTIIDEPYSVLEFNDGVFQEYTSIAGFYANTRFEFKIDPTPNQITKMNVLWNGFGDVGAGTDGDIIYLYNFSSGTWVQKDFSTSNVERTSSFDQTNSFNDFVNSTGYVYVLARSYSPAPTVGDGTNRWASIDTDYIKLDIFTDITPPKVILESPIDYYNSSTSVNFICNVSDDNFVEEVSLVGDWNGGWHVNQTNSSGLNDVNYTFNQEPEEGNFLWNCYSCDAAGNCNYSDSNRTVTFDRTAPNVTLISPIDNYNFTGYNVPEFNFSVNDSNEVLDCEFYGDWNGGWHLNQTMSEPQKEINLNYNGITTEGDGFYDWNINCTDYSGNSAFAILNFSFATFLPPEEPSLNQISQTSNDGLGDVTINWTISDHALTYKIYVGDNLSNLSFLDETANLNYTDTTFAGERRRFYQVEAVNPVGTYSSLDYFGAHVYTLRHDGVNSKNLIAFPTGFDYLSDANDSYHEINGAVSFTKMNFTTQKKVTCNDFFCPTSFSCTDTACNFPIEQGEGYEVEINTTEDDEVNWSGVGMVYPVMGIDMGYNGVDTIMNKKWISMYSGTNLTNARALFESLETVDFVTNWDALNQTSEGLTGGCVDTPWFTGCFMAGTNFTLELEKAYEISSTKEGVWTQE